MAYGLQYEFYFQEGVAGPLGLLPAQYRVRFQRKDYVGIITEVLPGGDPVSIKWTDSDDRYTPIIPSELTINLAAQDFWEAQDLSVDKDDEMQVLLDRYQEDIGEFVRMWAGYIKSTELSEEYAAKPYPVQLTAVDGLDRLKNKLLIDPTGKRLKGELPLSQFVRTALALTGHDLSLRVAINLFQLADIAVGQTINGKVNPAKCPLYQAKARADLFLTEKAEPVSAYEALETILKPYGARLCQTLLGEWMIVRSDEAGGGWDVWSGNADTVYARHYQSALLTAPPTAHGAINLTVPIAPNGTNRASQGTTYQQGTKLGVRVDQQFGAYLNKLPNGDFSQVDATGLPIGYKRNNTRPDQSYVVGTGTELDPYQLRIFGGGDNKLNDDTPCVYTQINYATDSREYRKGFKRNLKGKAKLQNLRAAKIVVLAVRMEGKFENVQVPYILQSGGGWKKLKDTKAKDPRGILIYNIATVGGVQVTKPGYFDIDVPMDSLDRVIELKINFCAGESLDKIVNGKVVRGGNQGPPDPIVWYENFRLEAEEAGLNLNGTSITYGPKNTKIDTVATLTLGDVPDPASPYDRLGTLFNNRLDNGLVTTVKHYRPDATVAANPPIEKDLGKRLLRWLADGFAEQLMQSAGTWEGTTLGRLPYGPQTVLRFFDIGEKDLNGVVIAPYNMQLTGLDYGFRMMTGKLTALQMLTTSPLGLLGAPRGNWTTPDGDVEVELGDDELVIEPNLKITKGLQDEIRRIIGLNGVKKPLGISVGVNGFVVDKERKTGLSLQVAANGRTLRNLTGGLRKIIDLSTFFDNDN